MIRGKGGIALVLTLWVLVLLSVIALDLARFVRTEFAAARNYKEDAESYYLAMEAYDEARRYILDDPDPFFDWIDEEGSFRTDPDREPFHGTFANGTIQATASILDEESRVNINTAPVEILTNMFSMAGASDQDIPSLIDSMEDWKDADNLHRLNGAEDEYYEPLGYKPRNRPFDVPEEIMYVKGVTRELYYGSRENGGLHNLITTWGVGVNINTASGEVLRAFGLSGPQIEWILANRKSQRGIRSVPPEIANIARVGSQHYRIVVHATAGAGLPGTVVEAVLRRIQTSRGPDMQVLYWREGYEGSGT